MKHKFLILCEVKSKENKGEVHFYYKLVKKKNCFKCNLGASVLIVICDLIEL